MILPVKLTEFVVDSNISEDVLINLPYQIVIGSPSKMIWYTAVDFTTPVYQALVYEGATGITAATAAERITHRGGITVYSA